MTSPVQLLLAQEGVASEHVRVRWPYNSAAAATVSSAFKYHVSAPFYDLIEHSTLPLSVPVPVSVFSAGSEPLSI